MKKNEKKNNKIFIIIGIALLVLAVVLIPVISISNERKESRKNMEIIEYNYNELSTNVEEYNEIRTKLSEKLNNFIYENYSNQHEEYTQLLNSYNDNIKKIDNNVNNINDKCNVIYNNLTINKICDSYKIIYEKLVNLYVSDLTNYNNKLTSYNEYKGEEIGLFELVHKDYVDYNEDKMYEGKDVENETNSEE